MATLEAKLRAEKADRVKVYAKRLSSMSSLLRTTSYDVDKNVIDGKLISVDGDKDEDVEVQGENLGEPSSEVEHSSNAL
ncbi:hypothetical protein ACSQ67_025109 [Phaseolus vulgaris]